MTFLETFLETFLDPLLDLLRGRIVLFDTVSVAAWTVPTLIVATLIAARAVSRRERDPEPDDSDAGAAEVTLIPATTYAPNDHTVADFVGRLYASGWAVRVVVDTSPDLPDPSERGSVRTRVLGNGVYEAVNTLTNVHVIPDTG